MTRTSPGPAGTPRIVYRPSGPVPALSAVPTRKTRTSASASPLPSAVTLPVMVACCAVTSAGLASSTANERARAALPDGRVSRDARMLLSWVEDEQRYVATSRQRYGHE